MNRLLKIQGHFMPLGQAKTVSSTSINNTSASSLAHLSAQEKKFYPHLVISTEVREALLTGKAVVALESTIISHGMPYPQNLETALAVEQVARDNGAIPATIAILKGKLHVGLEREDLETLAKLGHECRKCSRRDLASVIAEKANGATTVAATMYIANMAGIKVFVTGGIGGVHRGVQDTMDISADLNELGRTPVAVICAGVKSILDIGRTLEYLETQGVSVVSYGAEEFPAFFTRHSGFKAPHTLNDVGSCARLIAANRDIGMTSGMVFAVPVPEHQEAESKDITKATDQALKEANDRGITGRDITPFLLSRIAELTNNRSLTSSKQLYSCIRTRVK